MSKETRILKGPLPEQEKVVKSGGGELLRVDVATLQSALLKCRNIAENALDKIREDDNSYFSQSFENIVSVARSAVFALKEDEMEDEIKRLSAGVAMIVSNDIERPIFVDVRVRKSKHGGESIDIVG